MRTEINKILVIFFSLSSSYVFSQNGVGVNTNTPKSYFEDNGSFGKVVTTITSNTTLDATHSSIVCNNGVTAIAVTLPAANTCSGRIYEIKRNAASTAAVTVTATIDGATNYVLNYANQSISVYSDGTNWQSRDGSGDNANWKLTGNSGTSSSTNFIGTTDAIDFVTRTNGTERMRVLSGGNVGIGTTSPATTLDVNGDVNISSDNNLIVRGMSMLCKTTTALMNNGQGGYAVWNQTALAGYASSGITHFINHRGTGPGGFSWHNTNDMATFTNMMTLTANGVTNPSLGILTANPESNLEVNGSFGKKVTSITGNTTLNDTHGTIVCNTNAATVTLPTAASSGPRVYEIKRAVGNTNNITINVSGGGTIDGAASYILSKAGQSVTVFSDGAIWLVRDGSGEVVAGDDWGLKGNASTVAGTNFIGTTDAIDFVTKTNGTERMRVLSGGDIGIGTTTPNYTLHINESSPGNKTTPLVLENRDAALTANTEVALRFSPTNSVTTRGSEISGINNGTNRIDLKFSTCAGVAFSEKMRLTSDGELGIGTSTPQTMLEVQNATGSPYARISNSTTDYLDIGFNYSVTAGDKYASIGTGSTTHTLCLQPNAGSLIVGTAHSAESIAKVHFSYPTWTSNAFLLENGEGTNGTYVYIRPGYKAATATEGDLTIKTVTRPAPQVPGTIWFGNTIAPETDATYNIGSTTNRFTNAFISSTVNIGSTTNKSAILNNGTDSFFDFYGGDVSFRDQGAMNNLFLEDLTGNVGIGTGGPQQKLSVQGGMNIDQGNQNTGTGTITNFSLRFGSTSGEGIGSNRSGAGSNLLGLDFYSNSALRMVIENQGDVGIGTANPTCKLDVSGSTNINYSTYGRLVQGSAYNQNTAGPTAFGITIQASGNIAAAGYVATSDNRVKKEVVALNNKNDLELLRKINLVHFKYIDTLEYSTFQNKGVIAQEIKKILPQAVNESNKVIPNVFELSQEVVYDTVSKELTVRTTKPHDFKKGDKIRVYDSQNNLYDLEVATIPTQTSFVLSDWKEKTERIFVYGKFVNDFHTVNYDYLFTTGLSAMQEMIRQQDLQEKQIQRLKAENEEINSSNKEIQHRLADIESLLKGDAKEVSVRK